MCTRGRPPCRGLSTFSFTPSEPGTGYQQWADLRTTLTGFQEYAQADMRATTPGTALTEQDREAARRRKGCATC